jgi:hypothetical protein
LHTPPGSQLSDLARISEYSFPKTTSSFYSKAV